MRGVCGEIDCTCREGECTRLTVEIGQGRALINSRLIVCGVGHVGRAVDRWSHCWTGGVSKISGDRGSDSGIRVGTREDSEGNRLSENWVCCSLYGDRNNGQHQRHRDKSCR